MNISKISKIILLSGLLSLQGIAQASPTTAISDTAITAKVKAQVAMNKMLSVFKVSVETNHGVVHLQGKLNSETQAETLVQIAQSTDGVKDVDTEGLTVKDSNQPFTDSYITAKVKGMFVQEKLFGTGDVPVTSISVETQDGTVYLKGTAQSEKEAENAVSIAKMINGVKEVKSDVKVNGTY